MCETRKDYLEFLTYSKKQVDLKEMTWRELSNVFYTKFRERITPTALRKRAYRASKRSPKPEEVKDNFGDFTPQEYTQHNSDGTIEASTIVHSIGNLNGDKTEIMKMLGYNDKEWELLSWRITIWDGGKDGASKYSVKYKIKPIVEPSLLDYTEAVVKLLSDKIKPFTFKDNYKAPKSLDKTKLMEIPPVELHLGKIASKRTTNEEYNIEIAKKRFYEIFDLVFEKQKKEMCGKCVLVIGSDFFNSESDNATTTHKIVQQNCAHYIDIFTEGVEMYINVINKLRKEFEQVNVMLCSGNHARAMEFFLYVALQQAYSKDTIVKFSNNYQETQYFEFGENVIFYNHGDSDLKRLIKSIPAEFPHIWGKHYYRELHLGHLHKETVVDDEAGMITRRVGSPCGTDVWHKLNRFVGATKKHQVFVWDKNKGLSNIYYISF